jgi:hypothetical protein
MGFEGSTKMEKWRGIFVYLGSALNDGSSLIIGHKNKIKL